MNEKISDMQLAGAKRIVVIEKSEKQMDNWGISMPAVEPLVLDFGLNDFDNVGLIEYWIANEFEAGYCAKFLFLFDGQTCPMHSHKEKHETFFVLKGKVKMSADGNDIFLGEGDVLPVPTEIKHSFKGLGNSLVLEISMPCNVDDNQFANPLIMKWLKLNKS